MFAWGMEWSNERVMNLTSVIYLIMAMQFVCVHGHLPFKDNAIRPITWSLTFSGQFNSSTSMVLNLSRTMQFVHVHGYLPFKDNAIRLRTW